MFGLNWYPAFVSSENEYMLCIWSLNESILRWGEDEKNFQSKELFGAEEFNLAIAILNSEAPNYSEDWKFVSSFSYLDKESSMTKLIFFYIRATFHPHFLFLGTKKFSSLGTKNFLSLIFNPTGTKKSFCPHFLSLGTKNYAGFFSH